jgi:hypothetical protein
VSWTLRIKTGTDDHILDFPTEQEARAAAEETLSAMQSNNLRPVTIGSRLTVRGASIISADVFDRG